MPYALPVGVIALWQIGSSLGLISDRVLPAPLEVIETAVRLTLSGELLVNAGVSAARAIAGLIVGGTIGFALGLANGLSRRWESVTDTSLQMIRNIPNLALIPLVILWFGIGEEAKLFLVALGVMFPIYVNTYLGVRTADAQLVEMGRTYGMSGWTLFRRVILPGALPSIFVGLRSALGIMWLTLIVAETIAASSGLGHMAMEARDFLEIDIVVLAILIYALLGKLADVATRFLERRMLAWHPAYQIK
jgi:sulfonate transport system permease protein